MEPLKSPPLVEVILELRWKLTKGDHPEIMPDPNYSLLVGKLHEAIKADYPFHEPLPASAIPDAISPHMVKHRFRAGSGTWPLVQVGPGVMTLNDTQNYSTFQTFRPRAERLVGALFTAYPAPLPISMLLLRYIDAVEFDYADRDVWAFLREKMRVAVGLPDGLFEHTGVGKRPLQFTWQSSFPCDCPKGTATLRFGTGTKKGRPALIWEQMVRTADEQVPSMPTEFLSWLDSAHRVTEAWFATLIDGELKEIFSR